MVDKKVDAHKLEEQVMDLIVSSLKSGDRLPPEKKLAEEFGVSRTMLREVLSTFESKGFIVALQGSGRYVQMPDVSTSIADGWTISLRAQPALLLELLEIRSVLEEGFLHKAIERIDLESLKIMNRLVDKMLEKARNNEDFVDEDQQFHQILFSKAENVLLEQLLRAFWDVYEHSDIIRQHTDLMQVAKLHQRLLEAIMRKNFEQATHVMKEQFEDVRYRISLSLTE